MHKLLKAPLVHFKARLTVELNVFSGDKGIFKALKDHPGFTKSGYQGKA